MKRLISIAVAGLALALVVAPAAVAAEAGSWTGWIADEDCAKTYAKSATAEHKGCATGCLKRGKKAALSTEKGAFLLDLGQVKAEEHLGMAVTVEGELNKETNTIKVSAIKPAAP